MIGIAEMLVSRSYPRDWPDQEGWLLGRAVRRARTTRGLTQTEAAAELGVSIRTVQRWEAGFCTPSHLATRVLRNWLR